MKRQCKPIGLGTLSVVLFIVGIILSVSWREVCLGDAVLRSLGLKAWSNVNTGMHLTVLYVLLIAFVPSIVLGFERQHKDFGAKTGLYLASAGTLIIIIFMFINWI